MGGLSLPYSRNIYLFTKLSYNVKPINGNFVGKEPLKKTRCISLLAWCEPDPRFLGWMELRTGWISRGISPQPQWGVSMTLAKETDLRPILETGQKEKHIPRLQLNLSLWWNSSKGNFIGKMWENSQHDYHTWWSCTQVIGPKSFSFGGVMGSPA